ncbi:MAG: hypothetical protein K2L19_01815 [Eubacterium sp.]|nr:hypothetical protein [Eubacterium sp.]
MTCKDCIHYDVCKYKFHHLNESHYILDSKNIEIVCKSFKDKSKYIELPCKVGDTIYKLLPIIDNLGYCTGEYFVCDKYFLEEISIQYGADTTYIDNNGNRYLVEDFGKTVFLTKSEAEQKLKELKENAKTD